MSYATIKQLVTEAKQSNSTTYFTGKPCKRGHIAPRNTKSGTCLKCVSESMSNDTNWDLYLKRKYNIDAATFDQLLESQDNKCAICRTEFSPDHLDNRAADGKCVDHCHTTNVVRGLLCMTCNKGLGMFNDNISRLQAAIEYLKKWSPGDYV